MDAFRDTGRWPDNLQRLALVETSVEDLEAKGVKFTKGQDDLGPYQWAAGEIAGHAVGFDWHEGDEQVAMWAEDERSALEARHALEVDAVWSPDSWPKEDQPYAAPEGAQKPFG